MKQIGDCALPPKFVNYISIEMILKRHGHDFNQTFSDFNFNLQDSVVIFHFYLSDHFWPFLVVEWNEKYFEKLKTPDLLTFLISP